MKGEKRMEHEKSPWLSVLVPVYNVEAYLHECIESVLVQCDEGVEIIILDDQSTDASYQLIGKIAAESKHPLKIIQHEKNSGLSAARNSLIAAATGEYLWFLDSDDALSEGAISQLRKIVEENSPDLVMCDYRIWRSEHNLSPKKWQKEQHVRTFFGPQNTLLKDPFELFSGIYKQGKLHSWSKISKRALWLSELRFPEGRYFEDMVVTPQLALSAKTYFYSPSVWVLYRQRQGSILATASLQKIEDMSMGVNNVLDVWLEKYPEMDAKTRFFFIGFCIKIYAFTIKDLKKINSFNSNTLLLYKMRFYDNIKITKYALLKQYFLHGRMLKLLKYWRFL